ncbi:MAG: Ppx/GppA family phosphatase [Alphaproteobacteria bacterium]|nr:Ppx/GppA family phosphatase [Alphaproteobacteria bacterium]
MSDHQAATKDYVAVIDIGSNAVRLVVYDGLNRAPFKVYTERAICNLGADLATTGDLNPAAVKKAMTSLRRFSGLLAEMKIKNVRAVATAALRDAKNGKVFIAKVKKDFGLTIAVIGGEEEARLAALGVLANGFGGSGVIGDYGGGSLELIVVKNYRVRHKVSLPLGSHRLLAEKSRTARVKMIETHLDRAGFLKEYSGLDFYAMGGAWRSMAKAHMHLSQYPLQLLDHYQLEGEKAAAFARLIARQSAARLEKTSGMSGKRIGDMGVAALAMEILFRKIRPRRLIFSGTGLREGVMFDQLKPAVLKQNALLASCAKIAAHAGDSKILHRWLAPLFAGQDAEFLKLLEASCLLSDVSTLEHEDYRAEYAFRRILVMPLYGIDHAGRAFLALSQYVRYEGQLDDDVAAVAQKLLDNKMIDLAVTVGLAQRLGYLLTGGALGLLRQAGFKVTPKKLVLKLGGKTAALHADVIGDALKDLAASLGKAAEIL